MLQKSYAIKVSFSEKTFTIKISPQAVTYKLLTYSTTYKVRCKVNIFL